MMTRAILTLFVALSLAGPALAVEPDEMLADPTLEARAREVSKELRCVVCQNQSIDESDADLARDMRVLVRDRIEAGDSNAEVIQYMVDRYGDFVTLTPPFKATTYALWIGPIAFALLALVGGLAIYRSRAKARAEGAKPAPLTPEEQRRLDALLADKEQE